jgi:hypothetical protein
MIVVPIATPVLDEGWTRSLAHCHVRQPAESGGHFPHATSWSERECVRGEREEDGCGPQPSAYARSVLHDARTGCLPPS